MIGRTFGHYHILERIGAGGMGEVYRARDERLERDVALKVLPAGTLADESARKRFRTEARALSRLNHPNIETVHDFDNQGEVDFLVLELIPGTTLAEKLRAGPLEEKEIIRLGSQLAEGLAAAHEKGIVHRDLKPGNLQVTPDGRLKILDFGLARLARPVADMATTETLTESYAVVGTLPYMAPEQIRGGSPDARVDLWAAGAILYEAATGQRPFPEKDLRQLTAAILEKPPQAPGEVNRRVSPLLEGIILKCLEKDPGRRYQTAADLRVDLQRSSAGAMSVVPTPRPRRVRRLASAVGLSVLALGVTGWLTGSRLGLFGPGVDAHTVLVLPMEIRGQVQGAEYAGRAFAEALAVNLAQTRRLQALPVPEVGELARGGALAHVAAARKLRAGYLLSGALRREGDAVHASLTLVDSARTSIVWGTEKGDPEGSLAALAATLAREVTRELGVAPSRLYDYYLYDTGSPAAAAAPEMTEAMSAVRRFQVQRGLEATRRLVERFPDEPQAHLLRGCALLKEAWQTWPSFPQRAEYEKTLLAVSRLDPNNPWDDYFRALVLLNEGEIEAAAAVFEQLLARDDLTAAARGDLLGFRATTKAARGDSAGAFADFDEALRLDPTNDYTYMNLAGVLAQAGRIEEALARARQAVALNPTSYETNHALAMFLAHAREWQEAVAPAGKACEMGASQPDCALYAVMLMRAGRREEARAAARAAASKPGGLEGAFHLAGYHALAGNPDEAVHLLRRAFDLMPAVDEATVTMIATDDSLAGLKDHPAFKTLLADLRRRAGPKNARR